MFDILTLLLLLFALGTILLFRSKHERHLIFFMVRTRHFLNIIDWLARLAPAFWKFVADLAIVVSFSGVGAAYLSGYRKESRNLDIILLLFGALSVLIWAKSLLVGVLMTAALVLGVSSLFRAKNRLFDFISATVIISSILASIMHWYLAVLAGCFGMLAIVAGSLIEHAFAISVGASTVPGVSPIIPWIASTGELGFNIPGLGIFVPLGYGIVSLILLLVVHEFAHGILARVHGLELKSTGLLTLGALPIGAFVEPDEEKFAKSEGIAKMRVLSMGSFANLVLAIGAVLLFSFLLLPSGNWVVAGSNVSGIANGTIVIGLDDMNLSAVEKIDLSALKNKSAVNLTTSAGVFVLKPTELSGLKIKYRPDYRYDYSLFGVGLADVLTNALFWIFFFNLNIALTNLLPIVPFDGGKMVIELLTLFKVSEGLLKNIVYTLLAIGVVVILINAYPLIYMLLNWLFKLGP
jgi:membrane-associated protease RseP (regulator of RpoE activity)